jgi:magnesium transporter
MITDCAVYQHGLRRPGTIDVHQAYEASREDDTFVWLGMHEPTGEEFDAIRKEFPLHDLAVEDALAPHQRPKLEVYDDSLFVVLRTARYVDPTEVIEFGQIMVFVGDGFLITVRHGVATPLAGIRADLERRPQFLRLGPGAVLHTVIDRVVDDYVPVIRGVDHDIGEIEQEVFSPDGSSPVERIYKLKREVLEFHRAAAPLVDPLTWLMRTRMPLIHEDTQEYFRDVHDHILRIVGEIDGFNSLLTSMLDANLANVTVRQNVDMRRISAWVAILAVPTMVAGIYGMNFQYMPELSWTVGYPLVLGLMGGVSFYLWLRFKRSGWL